MPREGGGARDPVAAALRGLVGGLDGAADAGRGLEPEDGPGGLRQLGDERADSVGYPSGNAVGVQNIVDGPVLLGHENPVDNGPATAWIESPPQPESAASVVRSSAVTALGRL